MCFVCLYVFRFYIWCSSGREHTVMVLHFHSKYLLRFSLVFAVRNLKSRNIWDLFQGKLLYLMYSRSNNIQFMYSLPFILIAVFELTGPLMHEFQYSYDFCSSILPKLLFFRPYNINVTLKPIIQISHKNIGKTISEKKKHAVFYS